MNGIQQITLESLLDPMSDYYNSAEYKDVPDDPAEVAIECMDIMNELSVLEQNMVTIEAAKAIKKAKSASKKSKVTKSKMKAKDAKAKKSGGKVVKISKVTKEGDEPTDGGTGPLPTTTDTNGMTDTDLDVDPEQEVEVTEVVDTPAGEEVVGTEGVDFIVEYECVTEENYVTLEATFKENLKKFADGVVAFIKKVGAFFVSIWKKFMGLFQNLEKFMAQNEAAIRKGLDSDKEISTKYVFGDAGKVLEMMSGAEQSFADSAAFIKQEDLSEMPDKLDMKKVYDAVVGVVFKEAANGKATLKTVGITYDQMKTIVAGKKDFDKAVKAGQKTLKEAENEAKKAVSKDDAAAKQKLSKIRSVAAIQQKSLGVTSKFMGQVMSLINKIARSAAGVKEAAAETPAQ
jgi:hypothetical protein